MSRASSRAFSAQGIPAVSTVAKSPASATRNGGRGKGVGWGDRRGRGRGRGRGRLHTVRRTRFFLGGGGLGVGLLRGGGYATKGI